MSNSQITTLKLQSEISAKEIDNKDSNSEIVKREEIKNTPFELVEFKGQCYAMFGRVTVAKGENKEIVLKQIKTKGYEIIINLIGGIVLAEIEQLKK